MSHNTAFALRRIRTTVTGDVFGSEVNSRDNLPYAGSLMQKSLMKESQTNSLKQKIQRRANEKNVIIIALLICIGVGVYYFTYSNKYFINNSKEDIEYILEKELGKEVTIRVKRIIYNKLQFIFTSDDTVGSGELSKGWNNKYKMDFYGYGTNMIRERIVKTKAGQYLVLAGRNDNNIGLIKAYIKDNEYSIKIPNEDYYLVTTPVENSKQELISAMIVYDRENNEIARINLPID